MSHTLTVAGLLIDSWRDQSPQSEASEMNLPRGAIPISLFRGTSDDGPSAPRLASLIALAATTWKPR
jgi:hypothetical protein